jgi:hypothetical protein
MSRKSSKNGDTVQTPRVSPSVTLTVLETKNIHPSKLRIPDGQLTGRARPVADEEVIALADSLNVDAGGTGQQQPIQVRRIPDTDEYMVIFGVTRKRAADCIVRGYPGNSGKQRNAQPEFTLRCEVVDIDDATAFKRNVTENVFRNATSPIDNAVNQEELRTKYGMSDAAITRLYGYSSQASVNRLKKLLLLPDNVQDMVHRGLVTLQAAVYLEEVLTKDGPEAFKEVWDGIVSPGENENDPERLGATHITATQVADSIKARKDRIKQAKKDAETGTVAPTDATVPVSGEENKAPTDAPAPAPVAPDADKGKPLTLKQVKDLLVTIRDHEHTPARGKEFASTFIHVIEGSDPKRLGLWIQTNLSTDEEWTAFKNRKEAAERKANTPSPEESFGSYTEEEKPSETETVAAE